MYIIVALFELLNYISIFNHYVLSDYLKLFVNSYLCKKSKKCLFVCFFFFLNKALRGVPSRNFHQKIFAVVKRHNSTKMPTHFWVALEKILPVKFYPGPWIFNQVQNVFQMVLAYPSCCLPRWIKHTVERICQVCKDANITIQKRGRI